MDKLNEIGDGRIVKMEVDYSEQAEKLIAEAEAKAADGKFQDAIDSLLSLEKDTRLAADMRSNGKLQVCVVKLCFEAENWQALNETIVTLTKKRSLIKQAVSKMVQECCGYVDKIPDEATRMKLIDTLRTVTAGKIYVEVERARLTHKLAMFKEKEGNLEEAATVLFDLQVETFGSMDRKEKVELLLEQMRLCLERKDYIRAQIISKKISVKFFEDQSAEIQQLKLKYYKMMIELDRQEENYLEVCRHFRAVYNTSMVQNDPLKLEETLKNVVLYILLAPHNNEQYDLLQRVKEDRNLEKIPQYRELIELFIRQELISWREDIIQRFEAPLRQGSNVSPPTGVFHPSSDKGKKQWEDFQTRTGEHNIRMIAKYYTDISLRRMGELLDWDLDKTEEFLCDMVVSGVVGGAKINRPEGTVRFQPRKSAVETLDEWGSNLGKLMDILNNVSHLIAKEEMVHKHLHRLSHKAVVNGVKE